MDCYNKVGLYLDTAKGRAARKVIEALNAHMDNKCHETWIPVEQALAEYNESTDWVAVETPTGIRFVRS